MSFISTASTLNIGDSNSTTVNITQATTLNLGKTGGNPPTSNATQPASTDSSTKIPTTAWVQSAISYYNTTYTVKYTTDQTITTPANCRAIDILLIGAGGAAGTLIVSPTYYGGSGSGGNIISCSNIPMGPNEQLDLSFNLTSGTGVTELKRGGLTLAKAFNGNAGTNATGNFNASGATVNNTVGVGDTSFGSFYTSFGSAGADSAIGGTTLPDMTGGVGCPKGYGTWSNGGFGMAQRSQLSGQNQGPGLCVITYHIGV